MQPLLALMLLALPGGVDQVTALLIDGDTRSGRFAGLSEGGAVRIETDAGPFETAASRVVSLEFEGPTAPERGSGLALLRLISGDAILARIEDTEGDDLRVVSPALGSTKVPLDVIRTVRIVDNAEGISDGLGETGTAETDIVWLRGKAGIDRLTGSISAIQKTGLVIDCALGPATRLGFAPDRVAVIRLQDVEPFREPTHLLGVVRLRDGSFLTGTVTASDPAVVRIRLTAGPSFSIRTSEIEQIGFRNGDFSYLSDMAPESVEETPLIEGDLRFGVATDRALDGRTIEIGGRRFLKGLALHSRTAVTWNLGRRFSRFTAAVGVDPRAVARGLRGAVVFRVLLDGRPAVETGVLRAGDEPHWIRNLEIGTAEKLTIVADFGDTFHVNGRALVGAAMVVK